MAEKIQSVKPSAEVRISFVTLCTLISFLCHLQVMLIGPIGPKLRSLIDKQIATPTFTTDSQDEIHMILEYAKGQSWGEVTAPCANRVIFSHDVSNAKLVALESFQESLEQFRPDLVVLSGAHLLDGQPKSFWEKRLVDIGKLLDGIPSSVPVHWELATVGDLHYFYHLSETLFPRIDSLGLNEQELLSAAISANASFDFDSIPKKPGVEWISDLLHWLVTTYSKQQRDHSRLSRVHFHSLAFHIVATPTNGPWHAAPEGLIAGAKVAGLQACNAMSFNPVDFELKMPLNFALSRTDRKLAFIRHYGSSDSHIVRWRRAATDYYLSPVLVCREPTKTVGLGDAISSLGLLYTTFITT